LASQGAFCGNPVTIWQSPVDIVMDMYNYRSFEEDFKNSYFELNKES